IFGEQGQPKIEIIDGRRVARLSGSGTLVYIGPDDESKRGHPTDWGEIDEETEWRLEEWMRKVGLRPTDWGRDQVNTALDRIGNAKIGGNFSERMLALDNLVQ